jgi:hypothetical protein
MMPAVLFFLFMAFIQPGVAQPIPIPTPNPPTPRPYGYLPTSTPQYTPCPGGKWRTPQIYTSGHCGLQAQAGHEKLKHVSNEKDCKLFASLPASQDGRDSDYVSNNPFGRCWYLHKYRFGSVSEYRFTSFIQSTMDTTSQCSKERQCVCYDVNDRCVLKPELRAQQGMSTHLLEFLLVGTPILLWVLKGVLAAYRLNRIRKAIKAVGHRKCKEAVVVWLAAFKSVMGPNPKLGFNRKTRTLVGRYQKRLERLVSRRPARRGFCAVWCLERNYRRRKQGLYPHFVEPELAQIVPIAALLDDLLDELEDSHTGVFTRLSAFSKALATVHAERKTLGPVLKQAERLARLLPSALTCSIDNVDAEHDAAVSDARGAVKDAAAGELAALELELEAVDDAKRAAGRVAKQPCYELDITAYSFGASAAAVDDMRAIVSVAGGRKHALRPRESKAFESPVSWQCSFPVDKPLGIKFSLKDLCVVSVGELAQSLGVRVGERITAVGGMPVKTESEFLARLRASKDITFERPARPQEAESRAKATLRVSYPPGVLSVQVESTGSGTGHGEVQLRALKPGEESRLCVAVHGADRKHELAQVQLGLTLRQVSVAEMVKAAVGSGVREAVSDALSEVSSAAGGAALGGDGSAALGAVGDVMRTAGSVAAESKTQHEANNDENTTNAQAEEQERMVRGIMRGTVFDVLMRNPFLGIQLLYPSILVSSASRSYLRSEPLAITAAHKLKQNVATGAKVRTGALGDELARVERAAAGSDAVRVHVRAEEQGGAGASSPSSNGHLSDSEKRVRFEAGVLGFSPFCYESGAVGVSKVVPGTQACALGVRPGDTVLSVGGNPVQGLGKDAFQALIRAAARPVDVCFTRGQFSVTGWAPESTRSEYLLGCIPFESRIWLCFPFLPLVLIVGTLINPFFL